MCIAAGELALVLNTVITGVGDSYIVNNFVELQNGNFLSHYEQVGEVYEIMENSKGEDVVITAELLQSGILKNLDVRTYPEYCANSSLAGFYGNNRVSFTQAEC